MNKQQTNQKTYEKIQNALVKTMSKQYILAVNKQSQLLDEALTLDEYDTIIKKTINRYNYNGHNFNPKYLPTIIAMALKEQEFQLIQKTAWNNKTAWNSLSKERPSKQNENSILKENLDIVYNFMKNGYDNRDVSDDRKEEMGDWGEGYDEGFESALQVLKHKIDMMTEEPEMSGESAIEKKMCKLNELAKRAEEGYVRLE